MADPWDLLIRGATVYDGSGAPPSRADVALLGDRIAAVGDLEGKTSSEVDASGLALAPGFIDVHSHDDFTVFVTPEMDFKTLQGVTTDVVGNCGMGAAPYEPASLFARALHPNDALPEWKGYEGYLDAVDRDPPSLNVAALVGHGTLRAGAMGNQKRPPDSSEMDRMRSDLREGRHRPVRTEPFELGSQDKPAPAQSSGAERPRRESRSGCGHTPCARMCDGFRM